MPRQQPSTAFADEETPLIIQTIHVAEPADTMATTVFWKIGAFFGAAAVGLGAFGAHGLKQQWHITDPQRLSSWATAAQYQLVHSLALLAGSRHPVASIFFITGMTLFSGSIYALVLDPKQFGWMGPVTPVGGLCLIFGWLALAFGRGTGYRRI